MLVVQGGFGGCSIGDDGQGGYMGPMTRDMLCRSMAIQVLHLLNGFDESPPDIKYKIQA